jgi:hypothetical protein
MIDKRQHSKVSPAQGARCRSLAKVLIPAIRRRAYQMGYAVGVHGTLRRDIDLIACPWRDGAVSAKELADAVQAIAQAVAGAGFQLPGEDTDYFQHGTPGSKPHGRRCWTFHLNGGPYIDLSIMPSAATENTMEVMNLIRAVAPTPRPEVAEA